MVYFKIKNFNKKIFFTIGKKCFFIKKILYNYDFFKILHFQGFFFFIWNIYFYKNLKNKHKTIKKGLFYFIIFNLKKFKSKFLKIWKVNLNFTIKKNNNYMNFNQLSKIEIRKKVKNFLISKKKKKKNFKFENKHHFVIFSIIKCLICQKNLKKKQILDFVLFIIEKGPKIFRKLKNKLGTKISNNIHKCFFCKKKTFSLQINYLLSLPLFFSKYLLQESFFPFYDRKNFFFIFFPDNIIKNFWRNKFDYHSFFIIFFFFGKIFINSFFFLKTFLFSNFFSQIFEKKLGHKIICFSKKNVRFSNFMLKKKLFLYLPASKKVKKNIKILLKKKLIFRIFLNKLIYKIKKLKFCIAKFLNFFLKLFKNLSNRIKK
jgi:hypothetical protein